MDADTAEMLRGTLRGVLSESTGGAVLDRLGELGWEGVVADDPEASYGALFEEQGRALARSPALDLVVLDALRPLLGDPDAGTAMAYPRPPAAGEPTATAKLGARVEVTVDAVALDGFDRARQIVVPVQANGGTAVAVLDRGDWLSVTPLGGLDPSAGWVRLTGDLTVDADRVHHGDEAAAAWAEACRAARRALGHELVGIAERMLEIAVDHVRDRYQFGRPIGSFQAPKHRLAEVLVTLSAAKDGLHEAWHSDEPIVADVARSLAGRAQAEAARQGQQVCGGIGFTTEFPLFGYVRRGGVLDALLGSWRAQRVAVGERLLRDRTVPRVPEFR